MSCSSKSGNVMIFFFFVSSKIIKSWISLKICMHWSICAGALLHLPSKEHWHSNRNRQSLCATCRRQAHLLFANLHDVSVGAIISLSVTLRGAIFIPIYRSTHQIKWCFIKWFYGQITILFSQQIDFLNGACKQDKQLEILIYYGYVKSYQSKFKVLYFVYRFM